MMSPKAMQCRLSCGHSSVAEVMGSGGNNDPLSQPSTSNGEDSFTGAALNGPESWSGGDSPFVSQINYTKAFLIGLEMPENKHLKPP